MIFMRLSTVAEELDEEVVPLRVQRVRRFGTAGLILYPLGCLFRILSDGNMALDIFGLALIILAAMCGLYVASTGLQRITVGDEDELDPMELDFKQRAHAQAYHVLASIAVLAGLYLQIAADTQGKWNLWMPTVGDHWNAIMWGAILFAVLLPTVCLAWSLPAGDVEDD